MVPVLARAKERTKKLSVIILQYLNLVEKSEDDFTANLGKLFVNLIWTLHNFCLLKIKSKNFRVKSEMCKWYIA